MVAGGITEERVVQLLNEALASETNRDLVHGWTQPKIAEALASEAHRQIIFGIVEPEVIERFNQHAAAIATAEQKIQTVVDEAQSQFAENNGKIIAMTKRLDDHMAEAGAQLVAIQGALSAMPGIEEKIEALGSATMQAQNALGEFRDDRILQKEQSESIVTEQRRMLESFGETFNAHRAEASSVVYNMRVELEKMQGRQGGGGETSGSKGITTDKKEVAVWKLPDKLDRDEFRHWKDTVDANLEAVHRLPYPELVLEQVRRRKTEVKESDWPIIMKKVKDKIPFNVEAVAAKAEGRAPPTPPGMAFSGGIAEDP